ncbi:FecR family protein [Flavobacterium sp. GT2N3]|uniref:FecR family protein n=1 Tax=unclassified Flavobacterium TaxID=196869 RepID=UPI003AB0DEFB
MEGIIVKYLSTQATPIETEKLLEWLKEPENIIIYNLYVKVNYAADYELKKFDTEKAKRGVIQFIHNDKNIQLKRKRNLVLRFAAVLILLIGISQLFNSIETDNLERTTLIAKTDIITLQLQDGTVVSLDPEDSTKIKNINGRIVGNQKRTQLVYTSSNRHNKIEYNTLKVPNGKRFNVTLSDGTLVYLNAGSTLKYPIDFIEGKARKVFLSGEAYFDVFSDKKHPFIVNINKVNVKALGTEFNITSYPEDNSINTVLVEGSVKIYEKGKEDQISSSKVIKPNYLAVWDKKKESISVKSVDSKIYTSWLSGKLIFRNTKFKEIRKVLERKYNIKIINNSSALDEQLFDATFDIESIEQILNSFSSIYTINYKIEDNVVIINN